MAVTIKDVANKAGVSISTVSRVINDSKPVSPESRRKVIDAIEKLEYRPNQVARSLVTKKSNLIGVIVDDIGSHYVAQIVRGIEEIGRMYDYDILLSSSYGNKETELKFMRLLEMKQAEGIILVSEILNDKLVKYMKTTNVEFVYLNKYYNIEEFDTVKLDNKQAAMDMMDYIIENGHKDIMYVTHKLEGDTNIEVDKIAGYKEKLQEIDRDPLICEAEGREVYQGYNIAEDIYKEIKEKNITAIFCSHDNIAIGIMNYFYDIGVSVPEEVSIVGYGDIMSGSIHRPTLTTIKEPYYDIGAVAVRSILKSVLEDELDSKYDDIVLPMRLIERNSCKDIR